MGIRCLQKTLANLVGGIYYTVLHTRKNGSYFADLDLKSEEGTKAIAETVAQVINWALWPPLNKPPGHA